MDAERIQLGLPEIHFPESRRVWGGACKSIREPAPAQQSWGLLRATEEKLRPEVLSARGVGTLRQHGSGPGVLLVRSREACGQRGGRPDAPLAVVTRFQCRPDEFGDRADPSRGGEGGG